MLGAHVRGSQLRAAFLLHGSHLIKFYRGTQHIMSSSSGESEFYAGIKAGAVLLGAMSMSLDLGEMRKGRLISDATATKATLTRNGHGRAKHIDWSYLWLQQRAHWGDLELAKVGARKNPTDLGAKYLEATRVHELCSEMNLRQEDSLHRTSLKVCRWHWRPASKPGGHASI